MAAEKHGSNARRKMVTPLNLEDLDPVQTRRASRAASKKTVIATAGYPNIKTLCAANPDIKPAESNHSKFNSRSRVGYAAYSKKNLARLLS